MKFMTPSGSTVTVTGEHKGIVTVDFDWFEEEACIDCTPDIDETRACGFHRLHWTCESCEGGSARLTPLT